MNTNILTITGRLTRDPELRKTTTGKDVAEFSLACNNSKNGDHGSATFFNCKAWGQDANYIDQFASKGRLMLVSGPMTSRKYQGNDGSQKEAWEVTVRQWELLDKPTERTEAAKPVEAEEYDPFAGE